MESREYYFYLWQNPHTGMTCYGITGNPDYRKSKYQGHCGFDIEFSYLLESTESIVKELESELKSYIKKAGCGYRDYEWIGSDVDFASVVETVEYLLGDKPGKVLIDER